MVRPSFAISRRMSAGMPADGTLTGSSFSPLVAENPNQLLKASGAKEFLCLHIGWLQPFINF